MQIFSEAMHVSVPPALVVDWLFGWLAFFFVLGVLGLCYAIGRWCCGVSCDAGTCCYGPSYSPYYGRHSAPQPPPPPPVAPRGVFASC
jgi:hypothetical protein